MNIYDQIKEVLKGREGETITATEIRDEVSRKFGTNKGSIIPSDYCYNRDNDGIKHDKYIFEFLDSNTYKFLGENYPYTGKIWHKPVNAKERVVGEWRNGVKSAWK